MAHDPVLGPKVQIIPVVFPSCVDLTRILRIFAIEMSVKASLDALPMLDSVDLASRYKRAGPANMKHPISINHTYV